MRGRSVTRSGNWRQALACFAILALSVRALLPAGYMVDHDHDDFVVRMCGGEQSSVVRLNLSTGSVDIDHQIPAPQPPISPAHASDDACAFANAASATISAEAGKVTPPARAPPKRQALPQQTTHPIALAGAPLPARGPPLHA